MKMLTLLIILCVMTRGKSCGGGISITRNVLETVSGDKHTTPTLMKPSNLLKINVKQGI